MDSRRLILLRHGQAVPEAPTGGDFERPLTARGRDEAAAAARQITAVRRIPDRILSSPAVRALATARIVAEHCGLDAEKLLTIDALYLASPDAVWLQLTRCGDEWRTILICGHNPSLSELAGRLGVRPVRRDLATAGLATATWPDSDWRSVRPETAEHCEPAAQNE
jgi:phosphohistidine phosphatase